MRFFYISLTLMLSLFSLMKLRPTMYLLIYSRAWKKGLEMVPSMKSLAYNHEDPPALVYKAVAILPACDGDSKVGESWGLLIRDLVPKK